MTAQKPTIKIHERNFRGKTKIGWLDSKHTFSFGYFNDPNRLGFRSLRVVNEDHVAPGAGFPTHSHRDMEIISIVLDGALEHRDSMGTGSIIKPFEIQKMSAGTGVSHSEYNHSKEQPVHFYQIWVIPDQGGLKPSYEQISLQPETLSNDFVVVGNRQANDQTVSIQQDAKMLMAIPEEGEVVSYKFAPDRFGFLQVLTGQVVLSRETLKEGDGVEISGVSEIDIKAVVGSQVLLFDMG